jgi:hypothetical protein
MTRPEILFRARKAVAESRAKYQLGRGGFSPVAPLPEDRDGFCDCSGFVAWCLGVPRHIKDALTEWIETSAIVRDARSPDGLFTRVKAAEAGDLIVYGDQGNGQGHVGVISEVTDNGLARKVIHCGSAASRRTGRAIEESSSMPSYFYSRGAIHVRFDVTNETAA